jgi:hypothetical protein
VNNDPIAQETEELVLRSRDNSTLKFRVTDRWDSGQVGDSVDFDIEIDAAPFFGRTTGNTHYAGSPSRLFDSIAASWRGWDGTKDWRDESGQVGFEASSDSTGHTALIVELSTSMRVCVLRATLFFDAGQLDDTARQVKRLFG